MVDATERSGELLGLGHGQDVADTGVFQGAAHAPLEARRSALKTGLSAIERQVEAIETYAAQTAEADARLRELQQMQQLEKDGAEVLDFLASTARAEVASAEMGQLSDVGSASTTRWASTQVKTVQ